MRLREVTERPIYGDLKMDPWSAGADIFLLKEVIKELMKKTKKSW